VLGGLRNEEQIALKPKLNPNKQLYVLEGLRKNEGLLIISGNFVKKAVFYFSTPVIKKPLVSQSSYHGIKLL
jgi:hypothetical protein